MYTINKVTKLGNMKWVLLDTAETASQAELKALALLDGDSFILTMKGNNYLALYWRSDSMPETIERHYYK
jgi:hypothetical protein